MCHKLFKLDAQGNYYYKYTSKEMLDIMVADIDPDVIGIT